MNLPLLDQLVPLERGEAGLLARAVQVLLEDTTQSTTPVQPIELLLVAPLAKLATKLHRRHAAEQAKPLRPGQRSKPWQCRASGYQLCALHLTRHALQHCGLRSEENIALVGILGKFQQKSLNLTNWINF